MEWKSAFWRKMHGPLYPLRRTGKSVEDAENKMVIGAPRGERVRKSLKIKRLNGAFDCVGILVNGYGYEGKFT